MIKQRIVIGLLIFTTCLWAIPDLARVYNYRRTSESIVILAAPNEGRGGTGFELKYGKHQFTVTNSHVCGLAKNGLLEAHSPFTETQLIHVLSESPFSDLCILEPIKELPALRLAPRNLKLDDKVSIWGHPLLQPLKVTKGKLLNDMHWVDVMLDYIMTPEDAKACRQPKHRRGIGFLFPICLEHVHAQTVTAKIKPGSSGSPVLNSDGQVSGVAFAGMETQDPEGSDGEIVPWSSLYIFLMNYTQEYVGLE